MNRPYPLLIIPPDHIAANDEFFFWTEAKIADWLEFAPAVANPPDLTCAGDQYSTPNPVIRITEKTLSTEIQRDDELRTQPQQYRKCWVA